VAELEASDVATFTNGRLPGDAATQLMLDAALITARRDAGWHVCPVRENDVVVIDGPDSRILYLPTRKLADDGITVLKEDGVTLTPLADKVSWSVGGPPGLLDGPVRVRKRGRGWWSAEYQAIEVTMTHGYTEEEAADWRRAVLSMVDQMALIPVAESTGVSEFGLTRKQVDDVAYSYGNPYVAAAEDMILSMAHVFADYRLPRVEFM
jgi:hypothetical protein